MGLFLSPGLSRKTPPGRSLASSRPNGLANGENVNRELIDRDYGDYRKDLGGAQARPACRAWGVCHRQPSSAALRRASQTFQGDSGPLDTMRYLPAGKVAPGTVEAVQTGPALVAEVEADLATRSIENCSQTVI